MLKINLRGIILIMKSQNNNILGSEPVKKLLFKLALPTIIAQIINMLYNIVDRIYIGHMSNNGALALTGLGICFPIIMIITAFAMLTASGGAPLASIFMGRDDKSSAEKILGNCLIFQIFISIFLTIILLIWNKDLLNIFGASKNTIIYATNYMNIYATGTIFVQITLSMNAFITAQGFTKTSMYTILLGAICNILLDPIFIYKLKMGVQGAALATIISQGLSCIWVLHFLLSKKTFLKIKCNNIKMNAKIIISCISLGLAPFIITISGSITTICFNSSLLKYGGDIAVGAMTILTSVMQFAMLPLQGLGQGAQPIISYNFGAKKTERVKKTFNLLLKVSMFYSITLWICIMLFPQLFIALFTTNTTLISFTKTAIRIYLAALLIYGMQIACQMTFISIGNAKASITVAIIRKFILLIPLIFIMPNFLKNKTLAVFTAEPIADVIAISSTIILFKIQFRKALKKL